MGQHTDSLPFDLPGPPEYPPETTVVVTPEHRDPVPDPRAALRDALRRPLAGPPLRELVRPGQTVAIATCDGTRPQPCRLMIRAILAELAGVVRPDDITVLLATGIHRGHTPDEIEAMFGPRLASTLRIVNHDAHDDASLTWLGTHAGDVPVWLNSLWAGADVRITTGLVEPDPFAGFCGGPALVAPGLAGLETVLALHHTRRTGHPKARPGLTYGNPVHDGMRAIAEATGVDFGLDVVLNRDQRIVSAFGGDMLVMHAAATAAARRLSLRPVAGLFDVVVTAGGGHPLGGGLPRSVAGMRAAATVVKPGGVIICAAEGRDQLPGHGPWREEPSSVRRPVRPAPLGGDPVVARLQHTEDVAAAARDALDTAGPGARLCMLPEGPRTIPYVER